MSRSYYLFCVSSTSGGNYQLKIKAAILPIDARATVNAPGVTEIQKLTIGAAVSSDHQVRERFLLLVKRRRDLKKIDHDDVSISNRIFESFIHT